MSQVAEYVAPPEKRKLAPAQQKKPSGGQEKLPVERESRAGGPMVTASKAGGILLLVVGLLVGIWLYPEARRYLKIRRM